MTDVYNVSLRRIMDGHGIACSNTIAFVLSRGYMSGCHYSLSRRLVFCGAEIGDSYGFCSSIMNKNAIVKFLPQVNSLIILECLHVWHVQHWAILSPLQPTRLLTGPAFQTSLVLPS